MVKVKRRCYYCQPLHYDPNYIFFDSEYPDSKCLRIGREMIEKKFCYMCEGYKSIEQGKIENKSW